MKNAKTIVASFAALAILIAQAVQEVVDGGGDWTTEDTVVALIAIANAIGVYLTRNTTNDLAVAANESVAYAGPRTEGTSTRL